MSERIKVNENLIRNILLCDPITSRGREKLAALGLEGKIGPKEFFNRLWAKPFNESEAEKINETDSTDPSPYDYRHVQFKDVNDRRNRFEKRFKESSGAHFTALMGVVGSGKSIEIQRRVFESSGSQYLPYRHDEYDGMYSEAEKADEIETPFFPASPNAILIDLECSMKTVTQGDSYKCPNLDKPLWLFCTTLLDTLIYYIIFLHREHRGKLKSIENNLFEYFKNERRNVNSVNNKQIEVFKKISMWANAPEDDPNSEIFGDIFKLILDLLDSKPTERARDRDTSQEAAKKDINTLLNMLYLVAFCVNPDEPITVIVDNIEDYIATGNTDNDAQAEAIRLSNLDVKDIYDCLRQAVADYGKYALDVWKSTTYTKKPTSNIFMVARRTTVELLEPTTFLNAHEARIDDLFDITGDTEIEKIWDQKKKLLWDESRILKDNCEDSVGDYIAFADGIIHDAVKASSIQQKAARILARGLRRIGQNESTIIYEMYKLLTGVPSGGEGTSKYIDLETFKNISKSKDASKYILRQAIMEYYFQLQIKQTQLNNNPVGQRWKHLNVGHLAPRDKTGTYIGTNGKPLSSGPNAPTWKYSKVVYADGDSIRNPLWRSFLHRILCVLEKHQQQGIDATGCVGIAPTYSLVSLYELMRNLFKGYKSDPTQEEFEHLAQVLLAAGSPERRGDYAPLLLMRIAQEDATHERLQVILQKIWDEGKKGRPEDITLLDAKRYGARLSEAGQSFLSEWQPSFSFFSALYCSNQPPLFFVKDKAMIASILYKVYGYSYKVMRAYSTEASRYLNLCGDMATKEITAEEQVALFEGNGNKTFRQQIRILHMRYLHLYADYIAKYGEALGFNSNDKADLVSTADMIRRRYNDAEWKEKSEIEQIEDPIEKAKEMDNLCVCF